MKHKWNDLSKIPKASKEAFDKLTYSEISDRLADAIYGQSIERNSNPDVPIDITIIETDTTFSVTFNRPGLVLTTGTGGFKMMLDRVGGSIDFMKTSYNGRILMLEEKQALVHRIKTL